MNNNQLATLSLATGFICQFWQDKENIIDDNIEELYIVSAKLIKKYISTEERLIKFTEQSYRLLHDITEGKDVECNILGLGLGFYSVLLEDEVFKGSQKMQVARLVKSITSELTKAQDIGITDRLVTKYLIRQGKL